MRIQHLVVYHHGYAFPTCWKCFTWQVYYFSCYLPAVHHFPPTTSGELCSCWCVFKHSSCCITLQYISHVMSFSLSAAFDSCRVETDSPDHLSMNPVFFLKWSTQQQVSFSVTDCEWGGDERSYDAHMRLILMLYGDFSLFNFIFLLLPVFSFFNFCTWWHPHCLYQLYLNCWSLFIWHDLGDKDQGHKLYIPPVFCFVITHP